MTVEPTSGPSTSVNEVLLAEPRGFCAGVDRAIEIVERALLRFGAPIYVRHEIVHNTYVVNDLKARGAIFIEDLADVPPGATLVFSPARRARREWHAWEPRRSAGCAAARRKPLASSRPEGPLAPTRTDAAW